MRDRRKRSAVRDGEVPGDPGVGSVRSEGASEGSDGTLTCDFCGQSLKSGHIPCASVIERIQGDDSIEFEPDPGWFIVAVVMNTRDARPWEAPSLKGISGGDLKTAYAGLILAGNYAHSTLGLGTNTCLGPSYGPGQWVLFDPAPWNRRPRGCAVNLGETKLLVPLECILGRLLL